MSGPLAGFVRTAAFVRKEVADVFRQPRLVAALILGPFAILALFGVGYQRDNGPMHAMLVIQEDNVALREELEARVAELEDDIVLQGTTSDRSEAVAQVRAERVDVALVVPPDPYGTVRDGEQAVFELLHETLDPFEQATISLVARAAIDAVNRELLAEVIATGQDESAEVEPLIGASRESATLLRTALESGDTAEARAQRVRLSQQLEAVDQVVGPTDSLSKTLGSQLAGDGAAAGLGERLADVADRIDELDFGSVDEPLNDEIDDVRTIETDLEELEVALADFQGVKPEVLVSPLAVDTQLVGAVQVDVTDFYAPGVITLLLQHLAITFASLSLVRERALGTTEVFRVAPLGPTHILTGKYIGYTLGASVVAAALSLLTLVVFGVPLEGSYVDYAVIQVLLIFASLGVGFVISSIVTSDTQAVNVAMIVLLLSIFFSGFFLSLDRLLPEVRAVSWMLPITHALDSMRDVMFRGLRIELRTWLALLGGGAALYATGWVMMYRRLRSA